MCVDLYISVTTHPHKQKFLSPPLRTYDPSLRPMLIVLDFNSIKNICDKYDTNYTKGDQACLAIFTNVYVGIILVNFSITP